MFALATFTKLPGRRRKIACFLQLALVSMLCGAARGQPLESGDPGFGWQWVRQQPFTIQGINSYWQTWDFAQYVDAGFTVLSWHPGNWHSVAGRSGPQADMPWHPFDRWEVGLPAGDLPGQTGWIVGDEPSRLHMPWIAAEMQSRRQESVGKQILFYTTAHGAIETVPGTIDAAGLYGDGSNPSYTYSQYLDDFIAIINPDVLTFNHYPFLSNGRTSPSYLGNLAVVRSKAQANNLPYWGWLQSNPRDVNQWPSDSDNRFNVYTHLTMGFTGFGYWTFDGGGLIGIDGNPTSMYEVVKRTNAEVVKLGRSLRFLTSKDVRFLPGRNSTFGPIHATPVGLSNWTAGAGGDPHLLSVSVNTAQAVSRGPGKDGLVGFFADDEGQRYFMLTNLYHGADLSAEAAAISFVLTFDNSVNSIWRLNRETGLSEEILLSNHALTWTLPGGTGDLFKYDNGNFAGVPESSAGLSMAIGATLWLLVYRHRTTGPHRFHTSRNAASVL